MQRMENPEESPAHQRFDFLIRRRPLTAVQAAELLHRKQREIGRNPQREAVLFALRELTGKDLGSKTEKWLRGLWPEKQTKP